MSGRCHGYPEKPEDGKKIATLKTDNFGDFWFERQEPGTYSLSIEKEGYLPRNIDSIDASKDVNVGDIELYKISSSR